MLFPASIFTEYEPLSAHRVRNLVANNALHFADQKCNTLVNWVAPRVAATGNKRVRSPNPISTSWARAAIFGPHRLTLRADGAPYTLRIALAGATATGGTSVEFGLVLVPDPALGAELLEDAASRISGFGATFAATTSTTPNWLAVAQGASSFVPSNTLARGRSVRSTLVDTGGAPALVELVEAWTVVWAKSASAVVAPEVWGVHVSEYVGL